MFCYGDGKSFPELRNGYYTLPMGRLSEVDDVVVVAEFPAGDLSSFMTGQHRLVNGGVN